MGSALDLSGVTPANIVPFTDSGEAIHEDDLQRHINNLTAVDDVNGILCNGHAGEVTALTYDERIRVVEIIDSVTDSSTPVIAGVVGGSTTQVINHAQRSKNAGADAVLIIPPHTSITEHHEAATTFFNDIATAVDIPIIVFQDPTWSSGNYGADVLADLVEIDGVIGVKDAVWDVDHYQDDIRAIRDSDANAQVMVASDEHMLPCLALRSDGIFLELAAVMTDHIINLYNAVEESDLPRARAVYDEMEPFVNAMYKPPVGYSHVRLKVALELQNKIETSVPRKPTMPISDEEKTQIEQAMIKSGLIDDTETVTPAE
jgi:4-hydroxy-tetrahydrodipicolinate synthase